MKIFLRKATATTLAVFLFFLSPTPALAGNINLGPSGVVVGSGGGGSGGTITLAAIGSSPNANGATLTGTVLNLEPASASFGGVLTTGAQTIAGQKTLSDILLLNTTTTAGGGLSWPGDTTTSVTRVAAGGIALFTAGTQRLLANASGVTVTGPLTTGTAYLGTAEIATPSTPSAGNGVLYFKSDGKVYALNDAGTETDLQASGSPGGSDTQIQYNNAGAFGGVAGFTFNNATQAITYAPASPTGNVLTITGGTLASTAHALSVTGTLSSTSAQQIGTHVDVTGAGADTNGRFAFVGTLRAGYTGTGSSAAIRGTNMGEAVSGNSPWTGVALSGVLGRADGTTGTGGAIGVDGAVTSTTATTRIGVLGRATTQSNSTLNVGMASIAANNGGTGRISIGHFSQVQASAGTPSATVLGTSAGLVVANDLTTSDIIRFYDNDTLVTRVADGGDTTIAPVSGHTGNALTVTGGTLASGASAVSTTATLANTGNQTGVSLNITSAGSGTVNTGLTVTLGAGNNGSTVNYAVNALNQVVGSANSPFGSGIAMIGSKAEATGAGSGTNIGTVGLSAGSSGQNWGLFGRVAINSAAIAVGSVGQAQNGTGTRVGGYFGLTTTGTEPTFASAALIASNGDDTAPIFLGRDNTTTVLTVADGGDTTLAPVSGHTGDALTITGGTLASTKNSLSVTGTMSSTAAQQVGVAVNITGAGSDANNHKAMTAYLQAGYTGAGLSAALEFANYSVATATDPYSNGNANFGVTGFTLGTTTGTNVAMHGSALGGNVNLGGLAKAVGAKNGATNVGVVGMAASNGGTSMTLVGGYAAINTTTLIPTYTSAAFIANNGDTTSPILLAQDNGTTVFTIADGGAVSWTSNATFGDASGDSVTSNAASWTYANDTTVALSGGVNGLNFDSNTLSIDATNNYVGIGTAAPTTALDVIGQARVEQMTATLGVVLHTPATSLAACGAGNVGTVAAYSKNAGADQSICVCERDASTYAWSPVTGTGDCT